jgi:hypothetical protein
MICRSTWLNQLLTCTPTEALKHGFSGVSTDNHPMCFLSLWSYAFVLRVWQSKGTSCHWSSAAWGPVASPGDNGLTKRSRLAIWNVCSWKKHVCMILYILYNIILVCLNSKLDHRSQPVVITIISPRASQVSITICNVKVYMSYFRE